MKLNWYKSKSITNPELIDTESSQKVTYLRRNVIEKQMINRNNEPYIVYEYDEAKLTKAEYDRYLEEMSILDIEQQRADIDYIALCLNVNIFG